MTEKIYITLMLVALLSVAESAVTRDQCPLFCTRIGFPVCGSDGRTYGNPCELRAGNCLKSPYQQVTLVRNGTCDTTTTTRYPQTVPYYTPTECSLACTEDYTPVCGSDGNTYSNACQLRVRNCLGSPYDQITIVSDGTCESITTTTTTYQTTEPVTPPETCPLGCTFNLDPVCGSDGTTYPNPCVLRAENCLLSPYDQVVLVSNGTCYTTTTTTTTTYPQTVPDPTPKECSLVCTADYTPVCGSDGNTYGNDCQLRVRNCKGSPYDQITIVSQGTCESITTTTTTTTRTAPTTMATYRTPEPVTTPEPCPLGCPRIFDPVCGSDGRNYSNACVLRAENCGRSPYQQVTIVRNGTCNTTTTTYYPTTVPYKTPTECTLACTKEYAPVCGSDGHTYGNPCELRVRNCRGSPYDQVTIASQGTCESITTTTTTTPTATTTPTITTTATTTRTTPTTTATYRTV